MSTLFTTAGETPRLADAFRILFPVANDWQTIGSLMHIPPEVLENIRTTEREVPTNCLRAMLGEAFRLTDTPLTWRALAEAVKPINPAKAKEIRDAYYRVGKLLDMPVVLNGVGNADEYNAWLRTV